MGSGEGVSSSVTRAYPPYRLTSRRTSVVVGQQEVAQVSPVSDQTSENAVGITAIIEQIMVVLPINRGFHHFFPGSFTTREMSRGTSSFRWSRTAPMRAPLLERGCCYTQGNKRG